MIKKVRYYIFLKDVIILTLTAFGGPQVHLAMMLEKLVAKRGYLSEDELIELHALCQILPGPTSTQTLTAIGFKIGGPNLAYLTLLVWILPAIITMSIAAIVLSALEENNISLEFMRFIPPLAIGIVTYSTIVIIGKVIKTKLAIAILIISMILALVDNTPYIFPIILLAGGAITALNYKRHEKEEKNSINIEWSNFIVWATILIAAAVIGAITHSRHILLFENFYRIGSLIFGGGQSLVPFMYTEFVEYKDYLNSEEFLTGYGLVQAVPGPIFSFASYVGSLAFKESGIAYQLLGGLSAGIGIFLPGTFLIFFVTRFWNELKKYRIVKASISGIVAASTGMVLAATTNLWFYLNTVESTELNYSILIALVAIIVLRFTKIPTPILIITGIMLGLIL